MKKHFHFFLLALFAIMFVATSCSRREEWSGFPTTSQNGGNTFRGGITGRIIDENHLPVKNALVRAHGKSVQTNLNGEFVLQGLDIPQFNGYVSVEKAGYFKGTRTFIVSKADVLNRVEIQLIPKTVRGTFAGSTGASITFDGVTLDFAPYSIMDANGKTYTGSVTLVGAHLNPESSDFPRIMPGTLIGQNNEGVRQGLESFGMLAVELQGSNGEHLQILTGKTVDMSMDVPPTKLASAPATLPLWYFDEVTGIWKQEGEATLQGGKYVGTLAHFSFWNCDYGGPIINLDAQFVDVNGNPVINTQVNITATAINDTRYAWTDNTGTVTGGMPYNSPLVINVVDNCGNILYAQNLGPYISNISLGTITISSNNYITANYVGTATDCNNAPVTNGFVKITVGTITSYTNLINGAFNFTVPACVAGAPVSIQAVDASTLTQSTVYTTTLNPGVQNIGNLSTCSGIVSEYIQFTVDGVPYVALQNLSCMADSGATNLQTALSCSGAVIPGGGGTNGQFIYFKIDSAGGYSLMTVALSGVGIMPIVTYTAGSLNITNWPAAIGQFADGNFAGTYLDQSNNPHTLSVNYHLIRTN